MQACLNTAVPDQSRACSGRASASRVVSRALGTAASTFYPSLFSFLPPLPGPPAKRRLTQARPAFRLLHDGTRQAVQADAGQSVRIYRGQDVCRDAGNRRERERECLAHWHGLISFRLTVGLRSRGGIHYTNSFSQLLSCFLFLRNPSADWGRILFAQEARDLFRSRPLSGGSHTSSCTQIRPARQVCCRAWRCLEARLPPPFDRCNLVGLGALDTLRSHLRSIASRRCASISAFSQLHLLLRSPRNRWPPARFV